MILMIRKTARRSWSKTDVRDLKVMAHKRKPAPTIAKALKRSLGASLDSRGGLGR